MQRKSAKPKSTSIIKKIEKISHGKWFDFSKAVAPVLIAGIFGTCIAHHYKAQDENQAINIKAREEATQLSLNIIDLMTQRRFYAIRAAIAFQYKIDEGAAYMEYDKKVKEWNDHLSSNLILIRRYFGEDRIKDLAAIIKKMNDIHQELLHAKNLFLVKQPVPDFSGKDGVLSRLYALDDDMSDFGDKLQLQLQRGDVDVSARPPLNKTTNLN